MAAKQLDLFKKNRMSYRTPLVLAGSGVSACLLLFLGWGIYVYWDSPQLINFLAAWIPFVFSVLFAFVPSGKEMKHEWIKWTWKLGVIAIGSFCSVLLWHQQAVNEKASTNQINQAVSTAVSNANAHTDQEFSGVTTQVNSVQQKIQDIGKQLDQDASSIDESIGKVGKPEPPEHPKLTFSLWRDGLQGKEFPLESETLSPDSNGNYHIAFAVRNDSSVLAQGIEEWVRICDSCAFASEPKGFDKPAGMGDQERHRSIPGLNAGVAVIEGNEFDVKPPPNSGRFAVIFKSTCNTCAAVNVTKIFWIITQP